MDNQVFNILYKQKQRSRVQVTDIQPLYQLVKHMLHVHVHVCLQKGTAQCTCECDVYDQTY